MASKLFSVPRVGRQLIHQLPKPQYRAFSAGSQRFSDTLAVVRSENPLLASRQLRLGLKRKGYMY